MNAFFTAFGKEIREQWRTYRFLVVLVVLALFGLLSPIMAYFMPEMFKLIPGAEQFAAMIPAPSLADAVGQYIKNIGQFGVILAILLPMGSVAMEKEKGTAALILTKPLPRGAFLLAKIAGYAVVFGASFLVAALAGYYYTGLLFQYPSFGAWMAMNALILVYCLVFVSLTVCFSTLGKSQALAGGLGLASLALLGIIGAVPVLAEYLPAQLITWGGMLILAPGANYWGALLVSLGIAVAAVLVAWLVFRRQEL